MLVDVSYAFHFPSALRAHHRTAPAGLSSTRTIGAHDVHTRRCPISHRRTKVPVRIATAEPRLRRGGAYMDPRDRVAPRPRVVARRASRRSAFAPGDPS